MRKSYVQIEGVLHEKGTVLQGDGRSVAGPAVLPDIAPYRSQIDGSLITNRRQHREHLRRHGCLEVGNEKVTPPAGIPDVNPAGRKEMIRAQIDAMRHAEFKGAVQRAV